MGPPYERLLNTIITRVMNNQLLDLAEFDHTIMKRSNSIHIRTIHEQKKSHPTNTAAATKGHVGNVKPDAVGKASYTSRANAAAGLGNDEIQHRTETRWKREETLGKWGRMGYSNNYRTRTPS